MLKSLLVLIFASALYGFSVGAAHSWQFAFRNLTKFPLLIVVTTVVCSLTYYIFALLLIRGIGFWEVQKTVVGIFSKISLLLASLSPVSFFLAKTFQQPSEGNLGEYPLFLGINILFISISGSIVVIVKTRMFLEKYKLSLKRTVAVVSIWLFLSLAVGGQWAWYLRPFFDVWSPAIRTPYCMGAKPDLWGANSFYEAVYHLFDRPQRLRTR